MILHRAYRDIQKCSAKYGEAWKEYERQVPYLFIPVSSTALSKVTRLTAFSMSFKYPSIKHLARNIVRLIKLDSLLHLVKDTA